MGFFHVRTLFTNFNKQETASIWNRRNLLIICSDIFDGKAILSSINRREVLHSKLITFAEYIEHKPAMAPVSLFLGLTLYALGKWNYISENIFECQIARIAFDIYIQSYFI